MEILKQIDKINEILKSKSLQIPEELKILCQIFQAAERNTYLIDTFLEILKKELTSYIHSQELFFVINKIVVPVKLDKETRIDVAHGGSDTNYTFYIKYEVKDYKFKHYIDVDLELDRIGPFSFVNYIILREVIQAALKQFLSLLEKAHNEFFKKLEETGAIEEIIESRLKE